MDGEVSPAPPRWELSLLLGAVRGARRRPGRPSQIRPRPPGATSPSCRLTELAVARGHHRRPHAARRCRTRAAAVFVITQQDIRRSGATTLAEALRLAPGVQVSRIDASQPAVGLRGFGEPARPLRARPHRRAQRVHPAVRRRPTGTSRTSCSRTSSASRSSAAPAGPCGAPTPSTASSTSSPEAPRDTHGTYVEAGAGNEERVFGAARWGGRWARTPTCRVYAKYADRDAAFHPDGSRLRRLAHGPGRVPPRRRAGRVRVHPAGRRLRRPRRPAHHLRRLHPPFARTVEQDAELGGGNLRARWQRRLAPAPASPSRPTTTARAAWSPPSTRPATPGTSDVQYNRSAGRHQLLAGLGYRLSRGATGGVPTVVFHPAHAHGQHLERVRAGPRSSSPPIA